VIGGLNYLPPRYRHQVRHCGGPGGPGVVLQLFELHHQCRERLALRAPELGLAGGGIWKDPPGPCRSCLSKAFRTEVFDGVLYVIINISIDVFLWDLAEQSPTPKNTSCCTCLKNRGRTFEICENIDAVKKTWKNHEKQVRALYVKGCEKSPKSGLCKKDKKKHDISWHVFAIYHESAPAVCDSCWSYGAEMLHLFKARGLGPLVIWVLYSNGRVRTEWVIYNINQI
jgi:hypothetical protein